MVKTARTPFPWDVSVPARQMYLVGGGIASMAAAAFMIRDGNAFGQNITILEESGTLGGSMDGGGSPEEGYVLRGGRMLESKYLCTFGLFSSIPTLDESETVNEETLRWNKTTKTSSKSRLFRDGRRQTAPKFGLSEKHILTIERLVLEPEGLLSRTSIAEQFDATFSIPISGSCGARRLPSSTGTVQSSSSAI
jgi:oleate hydratase